MEEEKVCVCVCVTAAGIEINFFYVTVIGGSVNCGREWSVDRLC